MPFHSSVLFVISISIFVEQCQVFSSVSRPLTVGNKTFYIENFFKASWLRASMFCKYHKMELASIRNSVEETYVEAILNTSYLSERYWIGGADFSRGSPYVWTSDGKPLSYTKWGPRQPDMVPLCERYQYEYCMEMVFYEDDDGWMWNNYCCETESYFICEAHND